MKKRTMVKRVVAATMAGTMLMSMTAFAEMDTTIAPYIRKDFTLPDANTPAPQTEFTFTITPEGDSPATGLAFTDTENLQGVAQKTINVTDMETKVGSPLTLTEILNLQANVNAFVDENSVPLKPGTYTYLVKEVTTNKYPGITYDEDEYRVFVTVINDLDTPVANDLKIGGVRFADTDTPDSKAKDVTFTNGYGANDDVFDVNVKKLVTGNQGNHNEEFAFTVEIDPDNDKDQFRIVVEGDNPSTDVVSLAAGADVITKIYTNITDKDIIHIYGLTAKDGYRVTETDSKGHEVYVYAGSEENDSARIDVNKKAIVTNMNDAGELTADVDSDEDYIVDNNKHAINPTGVAMTFAPYVLMLGAAGVAGGMFLRKKKEDF